MDCNVELEAPHAKARFFKSSVAYGLEIFKALNVLLCTRRRLSHLKPVYVHHLRRCGIQKPAQVEHATTLILAILCPFPKWHCIVTLLLPSHSRESVSLDGPTPCKVRLAFDSPYAIPVCLVEISRSRQGCSGCRPA